MSCLNALCPIYCVEVIQKFFRVLCNFKKPLLELFLFHNTIASLTFAPYHLLIGLYLGFLRERSGTLVVPMFAHGLHNAMVVFFFEFS